LTFHTTAMLSRAQFMGKFNLPKHNQVALFKSKGGKRRLSQLQEKEPLQKEEEMSVPGIPRSFSERIESEIDEASGFLFTVI